MPGPTAFVNDVANDAGRDRISDLREIESENRIEIIGSVRIVTVMDSNS